MDLIVVTAVMRALERLLSIGVGLLSIYLGFRLFLALPDLEPGAGRIKLPGGISIYLTRVGPGVFFSLFGSVIIALSFYFGVTATETRGGGSYVGIGESTAQAPTQTQRSYTGAAPESAVGTQDQAVDRATVVRMIHDLNRIPNLMQDDLAPRDQMLTQSLDQAKVRLMREVWDPEAWGDYAVFERWWRAGGGDTPQGPTAAAVGVFQGADTP